MNSCMHRIRKWKRVAIIPYNKICFIFTEELSFTRKSFLHSIYIYYHTLDKVSIHILSNKHNSIINTLLSLLISPPPFRILFTIEQSCCSGLVFHTDQDDPNCISPRPDHRARYLLHRYMLEIQRDCYWYFAIELVNRDRWHSTPPDLS